MADVLPEKEQFVPVTEQEQYIPGTSGWKAASQNAWSKEEWQEVLSQWQRAGEPATESPKGPWVLPELKAVNDEIEDPIADLAALERVQEFAQANLSLINKEHQEPSPELLLLRNTGIPENDLLRFNVLLNATNEVYREQIESRSGLTMQDLIKSKEELQDYKMWRLNQKNLVPSAYEISSYGTANFTRMDADQDGYLSPAELNDAIKKSASDPKELRIQELIKSHYRNIPSPSNFRRGYLLDAISPPQITEFRLQTYVLKQYAGKQFDLGSLSSRNFDLERQDRLLRERVLK